ncbi:cis-prenyltransferase 1, cis-prenyltransferase 3 [Hibiscus trionum]|uniref:Alkyl transferase n=1 Tax=Hibiscus trionum TaxID=183268 RepID=A0A9W7J265_HIBTR|nr:cis-prenyltransferase 1, cis-prenyltransferase 3 [Hibiscus trionum]
MLINEDVLGRIFSGWTSILRKCVFRVLRVGPIPCHVAIIMDGNRRYAKRKRLEEGTGHDAGAMALLYLLVYCYELGIKYVTAYAFSIDNFKRNPEEVQKIMDLMMESVFLLARLSKVCSLRVHFAGNLQLLSADLRTAAKKLMENTAGNSNLVLTICVSYTCSDEILHAVEESCKEKTETTGRDDESVIKLADIEKHMYMAVAPDPDILIRTGGECRLSNFLLWQSCCCHLSSIFTVWPEFGVLHLVKVVLDFQHKYSYFARKKNAIMELENG